MLALTREDLLPKMLGEVPLALVYIGGETCRICHSVEPKLAALLAEHFPKLLAVAVDRDRFPAIAAQWSVFSVPAILIFEGEKERRRFSGAFGLNDVGAALERPYEQVFG